MVLNPNFELVDIAGEYVAVPVGEKANTFKGVVALSGAAYFLLNNMRKPISKQDLLELLTSEYEVDRSTAETDFDKLVNTLSEMGVIEE